MFVCVNQKAPGKSCCANTGGELYFDYLKAQLLAHDLHGPNKIRVSKSACLGRCGEGPCLVIYPEAIWYTYASFADIDEIIQRYLINGEIVSHLLIK